MSRRIAYYIVVVKEIIDIRLVKRLESTADRRQGMVSMWHVL